jgi:hypothetical protein
LDSNCLQTTINNFTARGTGVVPRIDLANSDGVLLLNMQTSTTLSNTATGTYVETTRGSLVVQPDTGSNGVRVFNLDTLGGPAALRMDGAGSSTRYLASQVSSDTNLRFTCDVSGTFNWGSGSASRDTTLQRTAANMLSVLTADLRIGTVGKGLRIAEGSNAKMGTATLNGTTAVVVSTTAVTASSRIFLTIQTPGGTPASPYVSAVSAGTSFSIKSTGASDTSVVAWMLVEPA